MKVRVTKGRIKHGGQHYCTGEVIHVDQETANTLVARGIAERVRRSTKVRLQPEALDMNADDKKEAGQ